MPEIAKNYLKKLKTTMEYSFEIARGNGYIKMELTQINHNQKIKKTQYVKGHLVLCDHPKLIRGLSRGISQKYYGPFVIQRLEENQMDYIIRRLGVKKGKTH
jgi:hypothetical protein